MPTHHSSELSERTEADARHALAFPTLTESEINGLRPFGNQIHIPQGDHVWKAGDANLCMFIVLKGEMKIFVGLSEVLITTHRQGGFSGDIDVMTGRPSIVSAIAGTPLDLLEVQGDCVRSIVAERPALGELILRTFLLRRAMLQESESAGPVVVGSKYSPATLRIREFLARNRYPHVWEDLEANPDTTKVLEEFHVTPNETPVVILPNGSLVRSPSNAELAEALGINRPIESRLYDVVIVGAGPAGLAASVYAASEGLSTLLVDSNGPGGQAGSSSRIENYMGFPTGLSGQDLADRAITQAERFGAQMVVPAQVTDITCSKHGGHEVMVEGREPIATRCVVLAPGASYRKLDVDDQQRFEGSGIYYACTNVERILCRDDAVAVVGAGNSAGQAAVFMSDYALRVLLVVRGSDLRKTMSSYLAQRIEHSDKISVLLNSEICSVEGGETLEAATIVDRKTGVGNREELSGIFVMIGASPHTSWLPKAIARDDKGFILTGPALLQKGLWNQSRPPLYLETSCPGVFAVGDARANSVKRVASAVGEGSISVAFVHEYLAM
jgi:thioredoxin reductase (NADPH)